jgi:2-aminoethylphosphonate-pyruvate transaminase
MTSNISLSPTGDPWLLTPGPLTTSPETKRAMLNDFGSRDHGFIEINRHMRERLVAIINGQADFVCVPMQGSGTFAVEAMMGSLVPRDGKVLVLVNGAYGQRIVKICNYHARLVDVLEWPENVPVSADDVNRKLAADSTITHVVAVHCETTTGILNPIAEIAAVVKTHKRSLLIDAMSAFGAIDLDANKIEFDAVVASSNKCLEGTPGMGYCIVREGVLQNCQGNSPSLSLDLHDQWVAMEKTAQWRFTPPVQVIAAFNQALNEFDAEGGVAGRHARYAGNCRILIDGMRKLGFVPLLPDEIQAPIIVTFLMPDDPKFHFQTFYDALRDKGYVIYPGKLTVAETFRIGCIGKLGPEQMHGALEAVETTLSEMGVTNCVGAA